MSDSQNASLFDRLAKGLGDSAAYSRGELSLRTTSLPVPPPPVSAKSVMRLRLKLRMSQSVFAAILNVSTKLVQAWEQDRRIPDRGELRLIQIIDAYPQVVHTLLGGDRRKPHRSASRQRPLANSPRNAA